MAKMTTRFGPPAELRGVDVEIKGDTLRLTIRKDFDSVARQQGWAQLLVRICPGPFRAIQVALHHVDTITSPFFAGAVHLLDHYRKLNPDLPEIMLYGVSERIVTTIDIMHLRKFFLIRQNQAP